MSFNEYYDTTDNIKRFRQELSKADAVIIGAGAGLSTSAGFIYTGKRFEMYFKDFIEKYRFTDMYSGGFYPFDSLEEHWAYWSRYVYINRYMDAPKPVYNELLGMVKDKDYFVLTTNVDHCFQKAGFDKNRIFYTQGDYGLLQCSEPCHRKTYDNKDIIYSMVKSQGFIIDKDGTLVLPDGAQPKMTIPAELVPHCPVCGLPMSMNLRADDTFVEDRGWHIAADRYSEFIDKHKDTNVMFIELGVGFNTPGIIKYSFWRMTNDWKNAVYVCLNYGEAYAPSEIKDKSICISGDIGEILSKLKTDK